MRTFIANSQTSRIDLLCLFTKFEDNMKKHIFILVLFGILAAKVFADVSFYSANPSTAQTGIIITPLAQMISSKEALDYLQQQKTKGYFFKESNEPHEMIKIGKDYHNEINDNADPADTHMKSDLSKIKLAFKFKPISFIKPIGYAAGGVYIKDSGWTAISTYFNQNDLGACKFKLNNMKLSQGAVRIPQELVQHDINKKMTTVFVEGSSNSGFIYNVDWHDPIFNYSLECANTNFDKDITKRMIELAKKIDMHCLTMYDDPLLLKSELSLKFVQYKFVKEKEPMQLKEI